MSRITGEEFKAAVKASKLTLRAVAARAKVTEATVYNFVNGKNSTHWNTIDKLVQAFKELQV